MDKPSIHVLIPLWGERYISNFMQISLPALLAPQNIPELAKGCDITVVFLTTSESINHIAEHPAHAKLARYCHTEYEPIDDLIAECRYFEISLSLAFVRGITRTRQRMTRTWFIFFNADFIIADGSLATIQKKIADGNDVILATSFRASAEDVLPLLHPLLRGTSGAIAPRQLARLALEHRHHTVLSRTVNQSQYAANYWNQIYWQVDGQTLLARYFLPTIFCMHPRVVCSSIDSFIDYNMAELFCPNGKTTAIEDSDMFFLLEAQAFRQELYFLKVGTPSPAKIASSISSWATAWHRKISQFETVLHAEDLPDNLGQEQQCFQAFMADLESRLEPKPIPAQNHHHWVTALRYWIPHKLRFDASRNQKQPCTGMRMPLVRIDAFLEKQYGGWLAQAVALVFGAPPRAFPWHPLWINHRAIAKTLRQNDVSQQNLLFVTDGFAYDGIVQHCRNVAKVFAPDALNGHVGTIFPGQKFSACLIAVECDHLDVKRLLDNIAPCMVDRQQIFLFFGRTMTHLTTQNRPFMDTYFHAMRDLAPYSPDILHIGNNTGLLLTKWLIDAIDNLKQNPVWNVPRMFGIALASVCNNLACAFFAQKRKIFGVTGVLATFSLKDGAHD